VHGGVGELQFAHHLAKEVGTMPAPLHQDDLQPGARDRHDHPWQAGARPQVVGSPVAGPHQAGDAQAVQDVTLSDPGAITRGNHALLGGPIDQEPLISIEA